ncbi:MAG: hypothetical protein BRD55_01895 [Bacteroidetes bacterium SW_9_63_38]|nr:MAG: hypothetical protein BRD55_01895 [Bacteroidetes bacterium SW_9_63_38]
MRRLISSSILLVALVSCLFILPACDSGGSSDDGSGGTVTATSANSFDFSFSSGSGGNAKATTSYTGFAFQYSGTSNNEDFYAVYFSSAKTFDTSNPTGAEIAGVFLFRGTQTPSGGTYPVGSLDNTGTEEFAGLIVKGFDQAPDVGTRTVQILTGGDIEVANNSGNVVISALKNVTASQLVIDVSKDPNELQSSSSVGVSLNESIDPKDGVPAFVGDSSFDISFQTSGGN